LNEGIELNVEVVGPDGNVDGQNLDLNLAQLETVQLNIPEDQQQVRESGALQKFCGESVPW